MSGFGNRGVGLCLLVVGVLTVGLLLIAAPARAHAEGHGAHTIPAGFILAETEADDAAHGHLGNCHGGAFCPGAAVFSLAPVVPELFERGRHIALPEPATGNPAATTFDPPPPRILI